MFEIIWFKMSQQYWKNQSLRVDKFIYKVRYIILKSDQISIIKIIKEFIYN